MLLGAVDPELKPRANDFNCWHFFCVIKVSKIAMITIGSRPLNLIQSEQPS